MNIRKQTAGSHEYKETDCRESSIYGNRQQEVMNIRKQTAGSHEYKETGYRES